MSRLHNVKTVEKRMNWLVLLWYLVFRSGTCVEYCSLDVNKLNPVTLVGWIGIHEVIFCAGYVFPALVCSLILYGYILREKENQCCHIWNSFIFIGVNGIVLQSYSSYIAFDTIIYIFSNPYFCNFSFNLKSYSTS